MARSFNGVNSNRLSTNSVSISNYPITMACWARCTTTTTAYALMALWNSTTNFIRLSTNTSGQILFQVNDTTGLVAATSSTSFAANTWFHACGTFTTNTSRAVYLNGGSSGTSVQNRNPTGLNNFFIGSSNTNNPLSGAVAWATVWKAALAQSQIQMLAKGVYPLLVQPQDIVAFYPLFGNGSNEPDLIRSRNLSVTGTVPFYPQPRIIR